MLTVHKWSWLIKTAIFEWFDNFFQKRYSFYYFRGGKSQIKCFTPLYYFMYYIWSTNKTVATWQLSNSYQSSQFWYCQIVNSLTKWRKKSTFLGLLIIINRLNRTNLFGRSSALFSTSLLSFLSFQKQWSSWSKAQITVFLCGSHLETASGNGCLLLTSFASTTTNF